MLQEFLSENCLDDEGNPAGGTCDAPGLSITWQDGPLGQGEGRKEPNGTFVETVLAAARQRLIHYQTAANGKFNCWENGEAILHLDYALKTLDKRTKAREARAVEGTHKP